MSLSFSAAGLAQFGTGQPTNLQAHEDGPAPIRDLSGVWTRIRPEGKFRSGNTWTPEPKASGRLVTPTSRAKIAFAMAAGMGLSALANVIHPYPTQAEAIRQVGDAYNRTRLTPLVKSLFEGFLGFRR